MWRLPEISIPPRIEPLLTHGHAAGIPAVFRHRFRIKPRATMLFQKVETSTTKE